MEFFEEIQGGVGDVLFARSHHLSDFFDQFCCSGFLKGRNFSLDALENQGMVITSPERFDLVGPGVSFLDFF